MKTEDAIYPGIPSIKFKTDLTQRGTSKTLAILFTFPTPCCLLLSVLNMRLSSVTVAITAWLLARPSFAKFGLTSNGNSFTVDTNGGLVFAVSKLDFAFLSPNSSGGDSAESLELHVADEYRFQEQRRHHQFAVQWRPVSRNQQDVSH